jgi:hypothetical protein
MKRSRSHTRRECKRWIDAGTRKSKLLRRGD